MQSSTLMQIMYYMSTPLVQRTATAKDHLLTEHFLTTQQSEGVREGVNEGEMFAAGPGSQSTMIGSLVIGA